MPVNPNYAPPGFDAVEATDCNGCAFVTCEPDVCDALCEANGVDCSHDGRPDGVEVIFVARSTKPATANWPYDSEGTPA